MSSLTNTTLIDRVDACLPQTQCTRCGYPRCRDYAQALVARHAEINQCPPGMDATIAALARIFDVPPKPLDPRFGPTPPRVRAVIDEPYCIGCRKCLDVCPTDAIVGAARFMHTVLPTDCTGCELCVAPCPVDCITLVPVTETHADSLWSAFGRKETNDWRKLSEHRVHRHRTTRNAAAQPIDRVDPEISLARQTIRSEIKAAVERVRRRRTGTDTL